MYTKIGFGRYNLLYNDEPAFAGFALIVQNGILQGIYSC